MAYKFLQMEKAYLSSPLGVLEIEGSENGVAAVSFTDLQDIPLIERVPECLSQCLLQLQEYFEGKRKVFELKLDLQGTSFQIRVWKGLQEVGYGRTRTYLQQARFLGDEKAIRAVAAANGRNPVAIILPCHRIVGSDGSLTGYAGGLWRKKWLLEHENPPKQTALFS